MHTIALIDPGLTGVAGHHLDLDLRLLKQFRQRGHNTVVYCHRKTSEAALAELRPHAAVAPVLPVSPYDGQEFAGERFRHLHLVNHFKEVFAKLPAHDLLVFPSMFVEHFEALAALPGTAPAVGVLHMASSWPKLNDAAVTDVWRAALKNSSRDRTNTALMVVEPELLLDYEALLQNRRFQIQRGANPFDVTPPAEPRRQLRTIGLMGHQNEHKRRLLGELVPALSREGFQVLFHDSGRSNAQPAARATALETHAYVSDLGPLLARADAMVLPYDRPHYRQHGSGMAWQAIGAGAPVVGPAGTTISRLVHDTGAGTLFYEPTCADIMEAVRSLAHDYTAIARRCHASAVAMRRQHGASNLVDQMLLMLPTG